jgi:AmmeMemoRadiSam system protein A
VNDLPDERGRTLVRIAWEEAARAVGRPLCTAIAGNAARALEAPGAAFVSLHRAGGDGRLVLRGCLGTLRPWPSLIAAVRAHAAAVVRSDPRFPPVTAAELEELRLEVTELGPLAPLAVGSREQLLRSLAPGLDGLALRWGDRHATFLPQVWSDGPADPEEFVGALLEKAGLPRSFWAPGLELHTYRTRSWHSRWPG